MSMKHKDDGLSDVVMNDKARLKRKQEVAIEKMAKKGYVKMPKSFPWESMEKYMSRWYKKRYG